MNTSATPRFAAALAVSLAAFAALPAAAVDLVPRGFFVEAGVGERSAYNATVGVTWPWAWRRSFMGTEATGLTEAYVSHWSAHAPVDRTSYTQLGVVPVFRLRFNEGRSNWFAEGGIGLSLLDRHYAGASQPFSTRLNFVDVAGVGRSFGADRRQEVSLRIQHVSNGGIKKPNPGENFLQLRYARAF